MRPSPSRALVLRVAAAAACLLLAGLGWAALAPVNGGSHQAIYEIPRGTAARRLAGQDVAILPQTIRLTLGLKDVLVLRNADVAPHVFGPTLIMPGQSFSLPFRTASTYSFLCSAHASGQLNIVVDAGPAPGLERLRWRWRRLMKAG